MKFIHLGDLHIGKKLNEFDLLEDQKYILDKIIEIADSRGVDSVLIAGDIYDKSIPGEAAVEIFDDFLTTLARRGKKVFAISGNHDSEERINFGSRLFTLNNIYISGKYDGNIKPIKISDQYGEIYVWLLPYVKASYVKHFYPDGDTSSYDAAIRTVLSKCSIDTSKRNIILVHQFVTGANQEIKLAGSEISAVGTVERIGSSCFDDFDYVAMGHIHSAQEVGRESCRYAGSPLKYSLDLNEINRDKYLTIVDFAQKNNIKVETVPLVPKRNIRHIKGPLAEIISNAEDIDDYIYVTLTDKDKQLDAMARLREVYPYIMKLDYDNEENSRRYEFTYTKDIEERNFKDMVTDYFKFMRGSEPDEEEWEIIEAAARKAEVIE